MDDQTLSFASSGWTYDNVFVLYDHQTESLWYPFPGTEGLTCISGEFADRKIEELPLLKTTWEAWVNLHPGSKLMN